jgi:hypothetical protein
MTFRLSPSAVLGTTSVLNLDLRWGRSQEAPGAAPGPDGNESGAPTESMPSPAPTLSPHVHCFTQGPAALLLCQLLCPERDTEVQEGNVLCLWPQPPSAQPQGQVSAHAQRTWQAGARLFPTCYARVLCSFPALPFPVVVPWGPTSQVYCFWRPK